MPGSVGKGIKAQVVVFGAKDDAGRALGLLSRCPMLLGILDGGEDVAEDAIPVARPGGQFSRNPLALGGIGVAYVGVTPRRPEVVHNAQYSGYDCCACQSETKAPDVPRTGSDLGNRRCAMRSMADAEGASRQMSQV